MSAQVEEQIKSDRLLRLQAAIDKNQAAFNRSFLGLTLDVLFERRGRHPGQIVGRSPYLQPVQVAAPASLIGEIAAVTITEIASNSMFGVLASSSPCDAEVGERSAPSGRHYPAHRTDPSQSLPFQGSEKAARAGV